MQRQSLLLTLPNMPYFCFPESVGHYYDEPEHGVSREAGALNNFNIHYVVSGKGYVELDGVVHELRAGEAVLYFPLQKQRYYSSYEEPWSIRWFHFYGGSGLRDYLMEQGLHKSSLWMLRQTGAWEQMHEELLQEAESYRMLRPVQLSMLAYALLTVFVEQAVVWNRDKGASSGDRIMALLPLMQQEATKPFVLEEWADRLGVTPYYFCKLFKSATKMTPMDFITRSRLQAAKQWLLERREDNIGQIAEEAGYPSVSYFNKRFMVHEGMTPTAYRKLHGVNGRG
ncbi:transcriptional regulator, AraC family [Paenibacillus curdlanolyticus YK9]|uniref:Transcriptional regulator, AraC family n=1 Tax=Paenibacillus curdlanolyticus YK9 TaxID=717606 RepID=E0ICX3_9BACL|nr:AraC family transcriptional regulator [Paenibacillus curdlanolyticus]EFM09688.1 transcriptional regulator, AraC family [Paenibacillus curdlanolyticus YK9]